MSAAQIAARGRTLQKLSILREAASASVDLIGVQDQVSPPTRASALHAGLTAAFTGSMRQDAVQIYLFRSSSATHLYAQPFDGKFALPGEHHAVVEGTLPGAALLRETFSGPRWESPQSPESARILNGSRWLDAVIGNTYWDWRVGIGRFEMPWLAQVRPRGGASSHVCMHATGEARSTAHEIGLSPFLRLLRALERSLWPLDQPADQPFVLKPAYDTTFETVIAGSPVGSYPPPVTAPCDQSDTILTVLAPHAGGKLSVGRIPRTKEQNARENVLPPSLRQQPILALVDLTVLGSARDAVVFTPTHGVMRESDEFLVFSWPEIRAVGTPEHAEDAEVVIHLATVGEIALPCGHRAGAMAELFSRFAALP